MIKDYDSLKNVLDRALHQAAEGKGKDRHAAVGPSFDEQPMQLISRLLRSPDGLRYQAIKKIQESSRRDKEAAIKELLGAINYCAGAIIFLENED